jgi:uncharacterized protein YdeI (YjbR/CyaY-like superfamily)
VFWFVSIETDDLRLYDRQNSTFSQHTTLSVCWQPLFAEPFKGGSNMVSTPPANSTHPLTLAEWRAWLEENHARKEGVWLISYKKSSGKQQFGYEEAVQEALCFGWIDSKGNKLDEERTMLWFAPRKPRTGWSAPNKRRIEKLLAEGRMAPAGLAKIEAAKQDGSWSALDAVEALEIPPDLAAALQASPTAQQYFDAFPRSVKRAILDWIRTAKRPETRATRVEETARLAAENIRANQPRR